MLSKSQKKEKITTTKNGRKWAIFPKCPFKQACSLKKGRLLYTAGAHE